MNKMKLGAQLYTLREFTQTPDDFYTTMQKVADIGYKYVQISCVGETVDSHVIKKACDNTGLSVILTHSPLERFIGDTDKLIEEHKNFGCNIIGLGSAPEFSYDAFAKLAEDIAPAVEKAKKAGMIFSYHNHFQEFEKKDGKHIFSAFLDNTDKEAVKVTADVYWLHYAGLDEAEWLEQNADRISVTHFKDMGVHNGEQNIIEIMEGNLNYPKILEKCSKAGIEYNFVELDFTRIDPFEAMKISYNNLMSTGYFEK